MLDLAFKFRSRFYRQLIANQPTSKELSSHGWELGPSVTHADHHCRARYKGWDRLEFLDCQIHLSCSVEAGIQKLSWLHLPKARRM